MMYRGNINQTRTSFIKTLRSLLGVFLFIYTGYLTAQTNYFKVIGGIPHLPVFASTASISSPLLGMLIYSTANAKPMLYTGETYAWQDLCTTGMSTPTAEDYFKIAGGISYLPSKASITGTPVSGSIYNSTGSSAVMVYSGASWIKVSEMNTGTFTTSSNFQSFGSNIKTCKIPVLSSDPTPEGLTTGAIYINSTTKAISFYNGTSWQNVSCAVLATVTTTAASAIMPTSATSGGNVTSDGGATVTARGVCWNTSSGPTIALSTKTSDGTGTGSFTSSITGLAAVTTYYVRAYATNGVGTAYGNEVSFTSAWACGNSITVNHVASGGVAPVDKTVTYGTVTNIPGETSKCWITSNLGSDHQATAVNDLTEASAGWFWQFNRKQGYKNDGIIVTPAWTISSISENSHWTPANDPCSLELGSGWRIPTDTEWTNVDGGGNWTNWDGPWNSPLKLHVAGVLYYSNGSVYLRGETGAYWSSTQCGDPSTGYRLNFNKDISIMGCGGKPYGESLRCIK